MRAIGIFRSQPNHTIDPSIRLAILGVKRVAIGPGCPQRLNTFPFLFRTHDAGNSTDPLPPAIHTHVAVNQKHLLFRPQDLGAVSLRSLPV